MVTPLHLRTSAFKGEKVTENSLKPVLYFSYGNLKIKTKKKPYYFRYLKGYVFILVANLHMEDLYIQALVTAIINIITG